MKKLRYATRSSRPRTHRLQTRLAVVLASVALLAITSAIALVLLWPSLRQPTDESGGADTRLQLRLGEVSMRKVQQVVTAEAELVDDSLTVNALVGDEQDAVLTGLSVVEGDVLRSGEIALTISGRPTIALQGQIPAYRDIRPGSKGPDVEQLQTSLAALGIGRSGDPVGDFGRDTQRLVEKLYEAVGFEAPLTSPSAMIDIRLAERQLEAAQAAAEAAKGSDELSLEDWRRQVASAGRQVDLARGELQITRDRVLDEESLAAKVVEDARAAIEVPQDVLDGMSTADRSRALEESTSALAEIRRQGASAVAVAVAAVADAEAERERIASNPPVGTHDQALRDIESSELALAQLLSFEGVYLPRSEFIFLPEGQATVTRTLAVVGNRLEPGSDVLRLSVRAPRWTALIDPAVTQLVTIGADGIALDPLTGNRFNLAVVAIEGDEESTNENFELGDASTNPESPADPGSAEPGGGVDAGIRVVVEGDEYKGDAPERVTIEVVIEGTGAEVAAVPTSAVFVGPDRSTYVRLVVPASGHSSENSEIAGDVIDVTRAVDVTLGLAGGGYVELLEPDPRLRPGALLALTNTEDVGA